MIATDHSDGVQRREGMEVVVAGDIVAEARVSFRIEVDRREEVELQSTETELASVRLRPALSNPSEKLGLRNREYPRPM